AGMLQHVLHLVRCVRGVDRHRDGSGGTDRQIRHAPRKRAVGEHRNAVPRLHAAGDQRRRKMTDVAEDRLPVDVGPLAGALVGGSVLLGRARRSLLKEVQQRSTALRRAGDLALGSHFAPSLSICAAILRAMDLTRASSPGSSGTWPSWTFASWARAPATSPSRQSVSASQAVARRLFGSAASAFRYQVADFPRFRLGQGSSKKYRPLAMSGISCWKR